MSILKALQEYDQKVEDRIDKLREERNTLAKLNVERRRQLMKTTAQLSRQTLAVGLLLTELRKTMSVEQLDELTMGNLDLVPRVEFSGLTLVLSASGERLPVRAHQVQVLNEGDDEGAILSTVTPDESMIVFAKGTVGIRVTTASVTNQFFARCDCIIALKEDGQGAVVKNRWGVPYQGTFSEIIQALNEQYRQIKDVKK